jgi:plasmid stabilization system protein ParE
MAKRSIEWSNNAKIELFQILDFYYKRNGNRNYSIKVNRNVQATVKQLIRFPRLGTKTNEENIRVIFEGDFSIFYEHTQKQITIHSVWDNQRDPEQSRFNK